MCGAEWRTLEAPGGRPHFALTAEHLLDLDCIGPVFGEDLFEWRDDYRGRFNRGPDGAATQDRELLVDYAFSDYVELTGKDYEQHYRAPWTKVSGRLTAIAARVMRSTGCSLIPGYNSFRRPVSSIKIWPQYFPRCKPLINIEG